MRVVRAIARLNVGGPARQVVVLDEELTKLGCRTLLVYGASGEHEGSLADLAVRRGLPRRVLPTLSRRISALPDLETARRLTKILFEIRPDVLHTHTAKAGALGRVAALVYNRTRARDKRCAVVHTFHGNVFSGYFGPFGSAVTRAAERALARATDRIITLSAQQRDEVVHRYRIAPAHKVAIVDAGHDLDALLQLRPGAPDMRAEFGWTDQHVVITFVGRLVAIKDLPALVRAFSMVFAARPHARLIIAGDGDERSTVERLAAELRVAHATRVTGWTTDLPRLYATTDVVLLTSLNEGMPASLIEGMAAAKPVVATAVGGVPELVDHGVSGLLVPPRDLSAMVAALVALIDDAPRRAAMGAGGRERVRDRFAPVRFARETLAVYRAALADRRGVSRSAIAPEL